ncbi:glycine-rich RNA-binding protein-like [Papaver somniferum]|uniref:glycine-rich RNA-binding protein-like n=1 Tax=Papaver somniferum TaxID=3469 RepID=UPI000E7006BD|nr:glycine-rich RNA-binding protein-like [Papaver somniferum]
MRDVIERMNVENLNGRNITVNEAQSRGSCGGGGGGGGGYGSGDGDGCGYGQSREGGGGYEGRREGGGGGYGGDRGSHGGRSEGRWRIQDTIDALLIAGLTSLMPFFVWGLVIQKRFSQRERLTTSEFEELTLRLEELSEVKAL